MLIINPVEVFPPILLGGNVGGGINVFNGKVGQRLNFKTLAEGVGINITDVGGLITISVDEADLNYPDESSDLTDFNTAGVSDKDLLEYQSGTGEWQPRSKREVLRSNASGTTVANNTTATIYTFDKLVTQTVIVHFSLYRKTDTDPEAVRQGLLFCMYRTDTDDWVVSESLFAHDDLSAIGVTWAIDAAGNLSYTSTDYSGANPESNLKHAIVSELPI